MAEILSPPIEPAPTLLTAPIELAGDWDHMALGALNRWPGRTGVPITDYLQQWQASCAELGAAPHLPKRFQDMLGVA
jgi:hypothetical protein